MAESTRRSEEIPASREPDQRPFALDVFLLILAVASYLLLRLLAAGQYLLLRTLYGSFLVLVLIVYLAADVLGHYRPRAAFLLKMALIYVASFFLLFGMAVERAQLRWREAGVQHANDGLVQTEEAARMLLAGRDPYWETYFGTALEEVADPHAAFYHYVYLPATFMIHAPFIYLCDRLDWRYDGRWILVLALVLSLPLTSALARHPTRRLGLLIALGLNLPLLLYTADGRNDILSYFWIFLSLFLLQKGRTSLSMISMGIACASKQTVWFALPFYALLFLPRDAPSWKLVLRQWVVRLWPFYVTVAVILLPFVVWSPGSFYEDTVLYLTGRLDTSYPLLGIGAGLILRALHVSHSETEYVPFWIPQLLFGGPTLSWLMIRQLRRNTAAGFLFGFAVLQLVIGYFSRIFQDNYLAMILTLLIFAYLSDVDRP